MLERFAGFEYRACCWRLRAVARRSISNRTGEQDTGFYLQLELNGLASVGSADAFLERTIRGYSPESSRPVKNNYMIYKAFSRALVASSLALPAASAAFAQTREASSSGVLLDRVAATVNEGVVLSSELDEQMLTISERLREQKLDLPPQNVLRQQVLDRLVLQELQMQRADRAGIKVPDETAEQRAARRRPAATRSRSPTCRRRWPARASTTRAIAKGCARKWRCRSCGSAT